MSRWAEAFAALSRGVDTPDTMRHFGSLRGTVSQSVHSVTATSEPKPTTATGWGDPEEEGAAIVEHDGKIPRCQCQPPAPDQGSAGNGGGFHLSRPRQARSR